MAAAGPGRRPGRARRFGARGAARELIGAIAYGPKNSAWGSASGGGSAEDAKQKALSFCARNSDDCQVVGTFSNTCGAVAVVDATGTTFLATNEKRGTAENQAKLACTQKNRSGCRVAASICALP